MRKVVVYELLSLDGVAEAPDQFFTDWDDAMEANLAAVIATQDEVNLALYSALHAAEFLSWPDGSELRRLRLLEAMRVSLAAASGT